MELLSAIDRTVWRHRCKYSSVPEYDFNQSGEVVQNYRPLVFTTEALQWMIASSAVGAILGIFTALAVNTVLVEVSLSRAFALYFGVLVIFMGCIILWRARASNPYAHPEEQKATDLTKRALTTFAAINIASGFMCLFLDTSRLLLLPLIFRLVGFSILGMSASFALTFGVVDLLNLFLGFFRPQDARPLVESVLQIYVVLGCSTAIGGLFGALFGATRHAGVGVAGALALRLRAKQGVHLAQVINPSLCYPIGIFCGGFAGLASEYMRRLEARFNKIDQAVEFDNEI